MPDGPDKIKPLAWKRFARLIARGESGQLSEKELQTLVKKARDEGRDPAGVLLGWQGRKNCGRNESPGPDDAA